MPGRLTGPGGTAHAHQLNATIRELGQRARIAHVHCHAGAEEYLLPVSYTHLTLPTTPYV